MIKYIELPSQRIQLMSDDQVQVKFKWIFLLRIHSVQPMSSQANQMLLFDSNFVSTVINLVQVNMYG